MKTIKLELAQKIEHHLKEVETEYVVCDKGDVYKFKDIRFVNTEKENNAMFKRDKPYWYYKNIKDKVYGKIYKTLTVEELICFLPSFTLEKNDLKDKNWNVLLRSFKINSLDYDGVPMKTLFAAAENMLEKLLSIGYYK